MLLVSCLYGPTRAQERGPAASPAAQERAPETSPAARETAGKPLHHEQRDHYLFGTFGPPGLISAALGGGLEQWREEPPGWGQTKTAYFKRFASEYGRSAVSDTTKYSLAVVFNEDPSFRPCGCSNVMRRVRHAMLAPISAYKPDGRIVFSSARVAGMTVGEVVSTTAWYPGPLGVRGVAKHVGVGVASQIGMNLLREFILHRRSIPSVAHAPAWAAD